MGKVTDLSNQKFGMLTVKELHHIRKKPCGKNVYYWFCVCDCGKETIKTTDYLKNIKICSCGCLRNKPKKETKQKRNQKPISRTRLYRIWQAMKTRCYNSNHRHYCDYGGRGITVCEEWKNDFMNFYNWSMDNGYTDNLSIERKDNSGNYCPENCIWVDSKTQSNNKRTSYFVTYNGKTQTIAQWAEELGIHYNTLQGRLTERKWSIERALTTIPEKKK